MLEDLVAPLRGPDIEIAIDASGAANAAEPVFRRNPAIGYGLGNLLENAVDFAKTTVSIMARWTAQEVKLTVSDDGPGFDAQVLERIGDPFVTTRPGYGADPAEPGRHEGMGLGFFIAKTLLERSGAAVTLVNRPAPEQGARVTISWPRAALERDAAPSASQVAV
jgi:two-component system, sensor histidine kinase RegB